MTIVVAAIVVVWGGLLAAGSLSRVARCSRRSSVAIVTASYLGLAALALGWFGVTGTGLAAVTGMLLPYAVALAFALVARQ